jgi:hypothetical protein
MNRMPTQWVKSFSTVASPGPSLGQIDTPQMEGEAIMGLSLARTGEIGFENDWVKQGNFHD